MKILSLVGFLGCLVAANATDPCTYDGIILTSCNGTACPQGKYDVPAPTLSIGELAFSGCENLTEVTFPDSLQTIEQDAFSDTGLTSVVYLGSKPVTAPTCDDPCKEVQCTTDPPEDIPLGVCGDPCTYDGTTLTSCNGAACPRGPFQPRDDTTSIGAFAFSECESLTSVDLSQTQVTRIGKGAFYRASLNSITFPPSLQTIEDRAFQEAESLISVDLSQTQVTTIEIFTFEKCYKLASVTFPPSL